MKTKNIIFKKLAIVVITLTLCLATIPFLPTVSADTIYVPGDYTTIQAAVNAAYPGDTIIVAAGTYNEMISINKPLTLLGANAGIHPTVGVHPTETVGTRGPESILSHNGLYAIRPSADNITIDGFKFTGTGGRIIDTYDDANNFSLLNCIFDNPGDHGPTGNIQFGGGSHNDLLFAYNIFIDGGDHTFYAGGGPFDRMYIIGNKFNGKGTAIFWAASPLVDAIVEYNEFDGAYNSVTGTGGAYMNIGQGGNIIIRNNWFHDLYYTGSQVGIIDGEVTDNIFENIHPYTGYWGTCFELWGGQWGTAVSSNVIIERNDFYYNDVAGATAPTHGLRLRAPESGLGIDGSTIHVHDNNFYDGSVRTDAHAIWHQASGTVDGLCNWWSATTGPYDLMGSVDYDPWLDAPYPYGNCDCTPICIRTRDSVEFCTIQAAIDDSGTVNGDTIEVYPGTYAEQLLIEGVGKNNITLLGSVDGGGVPTTIIDLSSFSSGHGVRILDVTGVTFKNFEVHESPGRGIYATRTDEILIENIRSHNNTVDGIRVRESIDATIESCISVDNSGDGITFYSYGSILNSTVGNNAERGIYVNGQSVGSGKTGSVTISGNTVYNNLNGPPISSSDHRVGGIIVYSAAHQPAVHYVTIENNIVYDNVGPGILLYKVNSWHIDGSPSNPSAPVSPDHQSLVKANVIYGNKDRETMGPGDGILLYLSHYVNLEDNEIYDNENAGIRITNHYKYNVYGPTTNNTLLYNNIYNNEYSVLVKGNSNYKVDNIIIQFNNLYDNTYGLDNVNNADEVVDAICNWWGDNTGPSGAGPGTGESVSTNVDFDPWLDDPYPHGDCVECIPDITINPGHISDVDCSVGARWRNFRTSGTGWELAVGDPNAIGTYEPGWTNLDFVYAGNYFFSPNGPNIFTFTYDATTGNQTIEADVDGGLFVQTQNNGNVGSLDYLQISVVGRQGQTVKFKNVVLTVDSLSYDLCHLIAGGDHWLNWYIDSLDLTNGFSITGEVWLIGQATSDEMSKIEIRAGSLEPPCTPVCIRTRDSVEFCTIQEAIDDSGTVNGDIIEVYTGILQERAHNWVDLDIYKSLTIIGAGPASTIIELRQDVTDGVYVGASNVTLEGMTFTKESANTHAAGRNIRVGYNPAGTYSNLVFRDLVIEYGHTNLHFEGHSNFNNVLIENCDISRSYTERNVYFTGLLSGHTNAINGFTIRNSTFNDAGTNYGSGNYPESFEMQGITNNVLMENVEASNNPFHGIVFWAGSNIVLKNVTANNNAQDDSSRSGIAFMTAGDWEIDDVTIENITIENSGGRGLLIWAWNRNVSDATVTYGTISGAGNLGIMVLQGWPGTHFVNNVDIQYLNIVGNTPYGLFSDTTHMDVEAICNWWGDISGPTHGNNPCGNGDSVSDNVLYTLWLNDVSPDGDCVGAFYDLDITIVGNGIVDMDPDDCFFNGDIVLLTPIADPGWNFEGWSGPNAGELVDNSDGTWSLTMDDDKELTASFSEECYDLDITIVGDGGDVDVDPDYSCYLYGTVVVLTPVADPGWKFVDWSGPNVGDLTDNGDGTWSLTMDNDKGLTASFIQESRDIDQSEYDRGFRLMPGWDGYQEFVPSMDVLSSVKLYMTKSGSPTNDVTVQICKVLDYGELDTPLFEGSISPADVTVTIPSYEWVSVYVGDISVTPGEVYAIVLLSPDEEEGAGTHHNLQWAWCDSYEPNSGGPYEDGWFYFRKFFEPTWSFVRDWDFTFRTYGYE